MKQILYRALETARPGCGEGAPADYLPELAGADRNKLALCVTDCRGTEYTAGDWDTRFSIQSVVKTVILAQALEENGVERLQRAVGFEPTGDPFNSILRHEAAGRRPFNPMINAGTFATISTLAGDRDGRFNSVLSLVRWMAGDGAITFDPGVYAGESAGGDRNRSLAYIMRAGGVYGDEVEDVLDVHFKTSAILVNCLHLSRIGAVLANDGVQPATGERLLSAKTARLVRTVMVTCGMYDGSGTFAVQVGVPAKSGISGGVMAAVRGKMGLAAYSPALDGHGNSVAGMTAIRTLAEALELNIF